MWANINIKYRVQYGYMGQNRVYVHPHSRAAEFTLLQERLSKQSYSHGNSASIIKYQEIFFLFPL